MTRAEVLSQIDSIIDRQGSVNGSILSAAWTKKSRDLAHAVDYWPREKAVSLICEYGYLQGLTAALYLSGEGALASAETYEQFLELWFIVIQEYLAEGEKNNGTDGHLSTDH